MNLIYSKIYYLMPNLNFLLFILLDFLITIKFNYYFYSFRLLMIILSHYLLLIILGLLKYQLISKIAIIKFLKFEFIKH